MTSVSVVVPHFGDPLPTLHLIQQLRSQTHAALEIIVSDDASPVPFPATEGVTVVRRATNGGFGANVNSGASTATGEALLVLNSDLTVESTFVADMVAAARTRPRSVLAPRVVDANGHDAWVGRKFPRVRHQAMAWLTPLARFRGTSAWHHAVGHDVRAHTSETEVDWVVGAAMWIPMEDFRAVGGFDERFFMNSEEIDLQRRLRERDVRVVALRAPLLCTRAADRPPPSHDDAGWSRGSWRTPTSGGRGAGSRLALTAATGANFTSTRLVGQRAATCTRSRSRERRCR